jgi:hypothetical protein
MQYVTNKSHTETKLTTVLWSALYKYCFSVLQNVPSDIPLAAMTVRYSITSLIFTPRVYNSYFKRGTYNPDCEVS